MATAKEIKEKIYFEEVYRVLEGAKMKVNMLREELGKTYGKDSRMLLEHDRHLLEIAEYIDWKIQVLEKGTSFDWRATKGTDVEGDVSVLPPQNIAEQNISGGYLGG